MPAYSYERLSAQDNTFLLMERSNVYMHISATTIYEVNTMKTPEGGVDIETYKRAVEGFLHLVPRYRQKLKWIPYANHPVWVDDRHFDIDYHIRHTSLPRPGTDEQLRKLASRIMGQKLDRSKPLWEYWVVEGLERDRFAVITKLHHCMIDGSAGADLATVMFSPTPEHTPATVRPYVPRPAPSGSELLRDHWLHRLSLPVVLADGLRAIGAARSAGELSLRTEIGKRAQALGELLGYTLSNASETPINGRLGPHRVFDWLSMPLEEVRAVRRILGCTVNDLVLAIVSGAIRSYMIRRRVDPADLDFRVSAPVSVRSEEDRGKMGNQVSSWIVRLPLGEEDPLQRVDALHTLTQRLKKSQQALGVQMLMAAAEWAPAQLLSLGSQATSGPINMIVTNVPGPQVPLYTVGAELSEMYPQVPLLENTGLGVALFSYNGRMCWGFNADPALVPDLSEFVRMIQASFEEIRAAAPVPSDKPAPAEFIGPQAIDRKAGGKPVGV